MVALNSRLLTLAIFFPLVAATSLVLFNGGCEGPTPRTAPIAQETADSDSSSTTDEPSESEVESVDIPIPSGKLLGDATACTVRLGGDDFDGSGVIIKATSDAILVLTVAHAVVEGVNKVELFSLGSPQPHTTLTDIKVISTEERADLALIQANLHAETEVSVAPLAELSEPKYGYSVGCSGRTPPKVLPEHIIRAQQLTVRLPGGKSKRFMWETKKGQQQGRSGGPLLNDKGALLGIALGRNGENGYYSHIREISEYLIDNGLVGLVTCRELLSIHQGKSVDR